MCTSIPVPTVFILAHSEFNFCIKFNIHDDAIINCILVFQLGLDAHDGVHNIWTSERSLSVTRIAGD